MRQPQRKSTKRWGALRIGLLLLGGIVLLLVVDGVREQGPDIPGSKAEVVRVVDGDTIIVAMNGEEQRVRYTGIDTPETVRPDWPVEPFGPEAASFNRELVDRKTVWLEKDVSDTDQFGRLLRYVWLADGRMVNALLVEAGYATVTTFPPDVKYATEFARLQREARASERGLWEMRVGIPTARRLGSDST